MGKTEKDLCNEVKIQATKATDLRERAGSMGGKYATLSANTQTVDTQHQRNLKGELRRTDKKQPTTVAIMPSGAKAGEARRGSGEIRRVMTRDYGAVMSPYTDRTQTTGSGVL